MGNPIFMYKQKAREQQKKETSAKIISSKAKNVTRADPTTVSSYRKATKLEVVIYIIIAVLALLFIFGLCASYCATKPKKTSAIKNARKQVREEKSQTARIHVIHV